MIFNMSGSGGGAGLNFKVVGNPQPASASENTIWIDTDSEITSWIFSATEPDTPSEGMVWISTGTSSTVEFNALKKNCIMAYPMSSKQYVDGAWMDKTAKSHQDGAWVDWFVWNGELYQFGNEYTAYTGGWYASNEGSLAESTIASITRNEDSMVLTVTGGRKSAMFTTKKPVDLTGFNLVTFNGLVYSGGNDKPAYGFLYAYKDDGGTLTQAARTNIDPSNTAQTVTLTVSSLSGEHYICVYFYTFDSTNPYMQMNSLLLS